MSPTDPSSAQLVSQIDDLVLKILDLVPRKSRRRFTSVSKHWLSLISDNPKPFPAILLQSATPDGDLLPHLDLVTIATEEPSVITKYTSLRIERGSRNITCLRSSNGLLLCARTGSGANRTGAKCTRRTNGHKVHTCYYVYNPLTRQHDTLPPPGPVDYEHVTASLAHDPARPAHYKVVCMYKLRTKKVTHKIMIYSSETRRWRRWDDSSCVPGLDQIGDCSFDRWGNGVSCNGWVYYVSDAHYYKLCGFDTVSEKMVEIQMPSEVWTRRIVASSGRLHLLSTNDTDEGKEVMVYELEKDGSSWSLKHQVEHFGDDLGPKLFPSAKEAAIKYRSDYGYQLYFPPPAANGEDDELWLIPEEPRMMLRYKCRSRTVDTVHLGCDELEIHDQRTWRHHDRIVSVLELPRAV